MLIDPAQTCHHRTTIPGIWVKRSLVSYPLRRNQVPAGHFTLLRGEGVLCGNPFIEGYPVLRNELYDTTPDLHKSTSPLRFEGREGTSPEPDHPAMDGDH